MTKVLYARLGREIRVDTKTGRNWLVGEFNTISWTDRTVGFVMVVYWDRVIDQDYVEFFVMTNEEGQILDQTPRIENTFKRLPANIGVGIFYTVFPHPGHYQIHVYHNDARVDTIALHVQFDPDRCGEPYFGSSKRS